MFLATTGLSEFWDKNDELLYLGQWCRLYERRADWEGLRGRVLPSPWEAAGVIERATEDIGKLHEELLRFLASFLNDRHRLQCSERYWRILLGPWLLGYTAAIVDHELHLDGALAAEPGLTTWIIDPRDRVTAKDTAHFAALQASDSFQLQLFSELTERRGLKTKVLRLPKPNVGVRRRSLKTALGASLATAARSVLPSDRIFSDLYGTRLQLLSLMRVASLSPVGTAISTPDAAPSEDARAALSQFHGGAEHSAAAAALLPRHLPTLFLEGFPSFRQSVRARWPKLPRLLLTSVGWYGNETFKLLAAEAKEQGGRLVISQHGGGYGMHRYAVTEQHERAISDRYFTWGWNDHRYPGAKIVPLPNPKFSGRPRRSSQRKRKWLLISTSLYRYPYSAYLGNAPAAHHFEDQLEERARFLRALPAHVRGDLRVRLHHADLGWAHKKRLSDEFQWLEFDTDPKPWSSRSEQFDLLVVDHPQTSLLESIALDRPTLAFWDPGLWHMRPEVEGSLESLRRVQVLFDSPQAAASAVGEILQDASAWWLEPKRRAAVEAFRHEHARGSVDWLSQWKSALDGALSS